MTFLDCPSHFFSSSMMDTIIGSFTKKDALPTQSIPPLLPRALPSSSTAHNQLRRKTSLVLWFNSSDDPPSPHNSIYDAQYLSANNSEEASNGPESVIPPICKLLSSFPRSKNASSGGEPPVPFHGVSETSGEKYRNTTATEPYTLNTPTTDTPFLYGRGTLLKTITEQSSNATMYSLARRKSVDDLPNLLTQHDDFVLAKGLQRRHSFSLDDLALIEPLHHDGCSVIGGISLEFVPIHEIYAEPKLPLHAPLPRPQTPPGMPSWTQAQNLPVRRHLISQQPNHLQRFFSLSASGLLLSSHMSRTDHLTTGRAVSSPACRRIPRFRPTKSAYAPIDQYPFNRAPLAGMHNPNASPSNLRLTDSYETSAARRFGRRVRFTASATARDSEMDTLQNPMEHTTSIAINSITGVQATRQSQRRPTEPSCPHRKARQAALKTLGSSVNNQPATSPNHDYAVARLPVPPIRQSSSASSARIQH